jgi:ATP-binding cassette subfamily C (CFTR/MRP) protein 1
MTRREGDVIVYGSIAYAPQSPWYTCGFVIRITLIFLTFRILSATIRDNILFSHEYDETFYNLIIEG